MKSIVLSLILMIGPQAFAQVTSCEIQGAVRCMCSHSMTVSCDNGQAGFISDKQTVTSLILRVVDDAGVSRTVTLQNPPGTAREYYAAGSSDWVKTELAKRGIRVKEVSGKSFTTARPPELFEDHRGQIPVGGVAASTVVGTPNTLVGGSSPPTTMPATLNGLVCSLAGTASLVTGGRAQCANQKLCVMRVKCVEYKDGQLQNELGEADAACKASASGVCPSPTNCANDPDVFLSEAIFAKSGPGLNGAGTRGTR